MKIDDNGTIREMTAEEIAEYEKELANFPEPQPTTEEKLQSQIDDLNLIMADVIGGVL